MKKSSVDGLLFIVYRLLFIVYCYSGVYKVKKEIVTQTLSAEALAKAELHRGHTELHREKIKSEYLILRGSRTERSELGEAKSRHHEDRRGPDTDYRLPNTDYNIL